MIKKIIVFGFIISCAEFGQFAAGLVGTYQVNYRNHFEHITLDKKENSVFSSRCPIYDNEAGWSLESLHDNSAYRVIWSLSGDYYNVFSLLRRSQPQGDDFVKLFTNQDEEPEQNSLYHRWYMDTKQELDSVVEDFQSRLPATQNALGLISSALKSIETKNIFLLERNSFLQSLLSISPEFEGDRRNFCRSAGGVFFLTFAKNTHGYIFNPLRSDLIWKWKKQHEVLPYYYPPVWFLETKIKVPSSVSTLVVKEHEKNIEKQICQYLFGIKDKELFDYLEIEDRSKDTIISIDNYSEIYFGLLNSNSKSRNYFLRYKIYMKLKWRI